MAERRVSNDQLIRQFSLTSSAEGDQRPIAARHNKTRVVKVNQ